MSHQPHNLVEVQLTRFTGGFRTAFIRHRSGTIFEELASKCRATAWQASYFSNYGRALSTVSYLLSVSFDSQSNDIKKYGH